MNKVVSNPMRTAAQGGIAWTIVDFLEAFYLVALVWISQFKDGR